LQQAKHYINAIDFTAIMGKLQSQFGWSYQHAMTISTMYRNFLYLQKKYGKTHKLPPSEEMDEFWHMHILDTKKYRGDCEHIFGYYLDHYPYFGIDGQSNMQDLEAAFATMQRLYTAEFGEPIYEIRCWPAKIVSFFRRHFRRYRPKRVGVAKSPQAVADAQS